VRLEPTPLRRPLRPSTLSEAQRQECRRRALQQIQQIKDTLRY